MHQRGSTSAPKKHLRSLLVPPQTISKRKILKETPGLAGGSSYAPARLSYQPRPCRRMCDLTFAFLLLAARKRASWIGKAQLGAKFVLFQLMLYVILYFRFVFTYRIHVKTTAPKFATAIFEREITKLLVDHQTVLALQLPHKTRHTHFGWDFKQHVNVVGATCSFHNLHILLLTQFTQYFSDGSFLLSVKHLPAIFRRKYHVIFAVPPCVG